MQLEIWSDVVCPWCAIGRAHLREALAEHPRAGEVSLRWRSFELDPSAPAVRDGDLRTHLADKYRTSPDEAQAMISQMTERAAASGLAFRLDRARGGNTLDAHRLLHLAAVRGVQDRVKDRFLTAYLTDGVAIGDPSELAGVAVDAGLDDAEVADVLGSDRHADDVRADEAQAHAFGITGVPFFVLDRRYAVSGAQPAAVLRQALDRVFAEAGPLTVVGANAGHTHDNACADGSCAI